MKKNVKFSAILSLILTIIGLLINLIGSLVFKFAPLTRTLYGGEIILHIGFGINFQEIVPMSSSPNDVDGFTIVEFEPISLIISIIIIFVITLLVKTLISNKKAKQTK